MGNRRPQYAQLPLDATGRLVIDVDCLGCGYNLRGLQRTDACPECGQAVARAVAPERLRFANPDWLARVLRGVDWLLLAVFVEVVVVVAHYTLGLVSYLFEAGQIPEPVLVAMLLTPYGLGAYACWLLTTREWPHPQRETLCSLRTAARWVVMGMVAVVAAVTVWPALAWRWQIGPLRMSLALAAMAGFEAVGLVCVGLWLGRLARRIPAPAMVRHVHLFLGCAVAALLLYELTMAVLVARHVPSAVGDVGMPARAILAVGTTPWLELWMMGWGLLLLLYYRAWLEKVNKQARIAWTTARRGESAPVNR
jgi:hypothetical protein